jgi:hypothetical protein
VLGVDLSPVKASGGQSMAMGESAGDQLRMLPLQPGSDAARLSPRSPLYKFEAPQSDQLTRRHGDLQQGEFPWEQRKSSLPGTGVQPSSRIQEVRFFCFSQ